MSLESSLILPDALPYKIYSFEDMDTYLNHAGDIVGNQLLDDVNRATHTVDRITASPFTPTWTAADMPQPTEPPLLTGSMKPPARPRKSKAPTLCESDWEPYKARVIELHIKEKRPLQEVKSTIQEEFGFTAEIRQYRARISQWKLDKNIKSHEMKVMVKKRQQRKLVEVDKGDLNFRVRGQVVEPQKIDRWMKRHDVLESMTYSPSLVPSTPSAMSCQTISELGSPAPSPAYPTTFPGSFAEHDPLHHDHPSYSPIPEEERTIDRPLINPAYGPYSNRTISDHFASWLDRILETPIVFAGFEVERHHELLPSREELIAGYLVTPLCDRLFKGLPRHHLTLVQGSHTTVVYPNIITRYFTQRFRPTETYWTRNSKEIPVPYHTCREESSVVSEAFSAGLIGIMGKNEPWLAFSVSILSEIGVLQFTLYRQTHQTGSTGYLRAYSFSVSVSVSWSYSILQKLLVDQCIAGNIVLLSDDAPLFSLG